MFNFYILKIYYPICWKPERSIFWPQCLLIHYSFPKDIFYGAFNFHQFLLNYLLKLIFCLLFKIFANQCFHCFFDDCWIESRALVGGGGWLGHCNTIEMYTYNFTHNFCHIRGITRIFIHFWKSSLNFLLILNNKFWNFQRRPGSPVLCNS